MIKPKASRGTDAYADAVKAAKKETYVLVVCIFNVTLRYRRIHNLRVHYDTFPSHRLMHIGPWQAGDGDHFIHMTKLMALLYQDEITSKAMECGQLQVGIEHRKVDTNLRVMKGSRIAFRVYTKKHARR